MHVEVLVRYFNVLFGLILGSMQRELQAVTPGKARRRRNQSKTRAVDGGNLLCHTQARGDVSRHKMGERGQQTGPEKDGARYFYREPEALIQPKGNPSASMQACELTDNLLEAATDPLDQVLHISGFTVLDFLAFK